MVKALDDHAPQDAALLAFVPLAKASVQPNPPEPFWQITHAFRQASKQPRQIAFLTIGGEMMKPLVLASAAFAAVAAAALPAAPATAQALSSGDYAQCTIYDREGPNRGLDSVCLERKRTQLLRLHNQQSFYSAPVPYVYGSEPCPLWANGGRGFSYTVYTYRTPPAAAAFDSVQNGRPCMPQINIRLPGMP
jgi:hypothetical protein